MKSSQRPYTLQQALHFTQLSSQALRHWRKVLPPLKGRSAHHPCFSAGDLLAMRVISVWVNVLGGKVGHLADNASSLFRLCGEEPWPRIEQSLLVFDVESSRWTLLPTGSISRWPSTAVVLPIGEIARDLRAQLIGEREESPQQKLEFPMMDVAPGAGSPRRAGR